MEEKRSGNGHFPAQTLGSGIPLDRDDLGDRIMSFGLALAVVGVVVQTFGYMFDAWVLDLRVLILDASNDFGVWTWASSSATLAAGLAALAGAQMATPDRARRLRMLGLILVFMSLDDAAMLHEKLGFNIEVYSRAVWPLLYSPILVLTFLLLWSEARVAVARGARLIRGGLGLLVGAIALEIGGIGLYWLGILDDATKTGREWPYVVKVAMEEGAELAGWILIAAALAAGACIDLLRAGSSRSTHVGAAIDGDAGNGEVRSSVSVLSE